MKHTRLPLCLIALVVAWPGGVQSAPAGMPPHAAPQSAASARQQAIAAMDLAQRQADGKAPPLPPGVPVQPPGGPTSASTAVDPVALAAHYRSRQAMPLREPALYVMVSLSMPRASLDRLAAQAAAARATLVLRGVVDGSVERTVAMVEEYVRKHPSTQFQIDPTLFPRYSVQRVPTFVLADPPAPACIQACTGQHASVAGDVSIGYALEHLARHETGSLGQAAAARLKLIQERP